MRTTEKGAIEGVGEALPVGRNRPKQLRRQIAEESLQPGTSAAIVARRHGVNANQVFHWRKLLREGGLEEKPGPAPLLPVRLTEVFEAPLEPVRHLAGTIHIELGRIRIQVEGRVDVEALRTVLEQLGR